MPPDVSLLVPCYNAAAHLPSLVASARAQHTPFAEILFYDDGSTDDTVRVAESLGCAILRGGVNAGAGAARNRLAAAARCKWIHFQDADDPLDPAFLAAMSVLLDDNTDVAVCDADWLDERSRTLVISWRHDRELFARDPVRAALRHPVSVICAIFRRERFLALGGIDEKLRMWEDADLSVRLAAAGARYSVINRVLTVSLRRPESFSHDYRASWNCRLRALHTYAATLATPWHDEIAKEAEIAAAALLSLGDRSAARTAILLARRLGANPPTTRSPLLGFLKFFLPPLIVLALQNSRRNRAQ